MPTYVIGDVQGCFATLQALTARIAFEPGRDRLLFVGDLVNRGPQNVEFLRWLVSQGPSVNAVLGNHDLHLLGRARGLFDAKKRDTVGDVLTAPDHVALLEWLRARPFLLREGDFLLVHAGIPPGMTLGEAEIEAHALSRRLRGPEADGLLRELRRPMRSWAAAVAAGDTEARHHIALQGFVLLRTCLEDGTPDPVYSGGLGDLPRGRRPWFDFDPASRAGVTLLCGHWAALGLHRAPGLVSLDTGCVWGRALTALRLDDGRIFSEPTIDRLPPGAGGH